MGNYPPRGALAICTIPSQSAIGLWGWGFTPCGAVSTRGIIIVPRLSELYMYGGICDPGMVKFCPRVTLVLFSCPSQSAISRRGWGFHTVRGGFDPGDHRFRPWVVGVVDVWRDCRTGDEDLSSRGAARSRCSPEGQLPPRAPRPLIGQGRAGGGASANAGMKFIICLLLYFIYISTILLPATLSLIYCEKYTNRRTAAAAPEGPHNQRMVLVSPSNSVLGRVVPIYGVQHNLVEEYNLVVMTSV